MIFGYYSKKITRVQFRYILSTTKVIEYFPRVFKMEYENQNTDLETGSTQESNEIKTVTCPRCDSKVPATLYCLKCGNPLIILDSSNNENRDETEDTRFDVVSLKEIQNGVVTVDDEPTPRIHEDHEKTGVSPRDAFPSEEWGSPVAHLESNPSESLIELAESGGEWDKGPMDGRPLRMDAMNANSDGKEADITSARTVEAVETRKLGELDPEITELSKELMSSISLELWSIGLLQEGEIQGDHFCSVFDSHRERYDQCMERRSYLLGQEKNLEAIEAKLKNAKVGLSELELRKSIGDLREREYKVMAPALNWIIHHYEEEISEKREKITLIEDLTRLMPEENVAELKEKTEAAFRIMEDMRDSNVLDPEAASRVRASLEEISTLLGGS
jgi:hypothetical protein